MSNKLLTPDQDAYLRLIATGKSVKECTDALNAKFESSFSIAQIRGHKSRHHIVSGLRPCDFVDRGKLRITTPKQDEFIHEHYQGIGNQTLADLVNEKFDTCFTAEQMSAYKARNKLDSGLTGCFEKGHVPANKGKKFPGQTNRTTFKKGNMPKNTDPIGTEKLLADGYIWVKVDNIPKASKKVNWRPKHVKLWQDNFGSVPKGHVVIFLDGDRTNFDLDNLKMISQSTNARLNQNHLRHSDKAITEAGIAVAEVITAMSSAKRRIGGK